MRNICFDDEELRRVTSLQEPGRARPSSERPFIFTDEHGTYSVEGIIQFIRVNYTDQLLREALVNFNKVTTDGCSCIVSLATARHLPAGEKRCERAFAHYNEAMALPFAKAAFGELVELGYIQGWGCTESLRHERLAPVLHEEMARRYRLRHGVVRAKKERAM
jgi:hypothetical protein